MRERNITLYGYPDCPAVSTLITAKYIRNFGRKTMYFLSATLTIVFLVMFGVVDLFDLGYAWKPLPILIMSFQVTIPSSNLVLYCKKTCITYVAKDYIMLGGCTDKN